MITDKILGFGIVCKPLFCQLEPVVMDAALRTRQFFSQVCMEHLMVEHEGKHISGDPRAVQSSVDYNRIVCGVEVPQSSSVLPETPRQVSYRDPIIEVGPIQIAEN
jgi:hypothetical protein